MIKISQLPDAVRSNGEEILPIVQLSETRKAKAIFISPDKKVVIPEDVEIVAMSNGQEIKLLSASVVDGVTTVQLGQSGANLVRGESAIVTEAARQDGNSYVRINNNWTVRNPVTSINSKAPLTGGGDLRLSAAEVQAHIENSNINGQNYVSRDGEWISLSSIMTPLLDEKSNTDHTHPISGVTLLQDTLNRIEAKADNYAHDPAFGSVSNSNFVSDEKAGYVTYDKQFVSDITHTEGILTLTKPGSYMITLSGNSESTGSFQVQINDVDLSTMKVDLPGRFSVQDIVKFSEVGTIKTRYETPDAITASLVMTIHRM